MTVTAYLESGLRLDLPDGQHFRFAELRSYQRLSGQRLKEMDFAWIRNGRLFLLELRSYAQVTETLTVADFSLIKDRPAPLRFQTLIDKVTDSLLLLLAVWSGTEKGKEVKSEIPIDARSCLPLKLVIAVDLPAHLAHHLPALRDSLNDCLRGRIAVADVRNVTLLDYGRLLAHPEFKDLVSDATE